MISEYPLGLGSPKLSSSVVLVNGLQVLYFWPVGILSELLSHQ